MAPKNVSHRLGGMKEIFKGCLAKLEEHKRRNLILLVVLSVFAVGAAGMGLTKEKAQVREIHKISKENVRLKNIGCDREVLNPLRKDEHPILNRAASDYFKGLMEGETFVEKYDDIHVYTKVGEYRGTYIAFAEYRMKIKDIYTEVPGLVTLYATRDEKSGQYRIDVEAPKEQEDYVRTVIGHADVQELLGAMEEKFDLAVHSDALLRESLADLKNAYGAYTG